MRVVPTNCVIEGTELAKHIYAENGNILLKKGVKLTATLIEKIEHNSIYTIYIDDGYSDKEINDVIRPELRGKAIKAIRETFSVIEKHNHQALNSASTNFKEKLLVKSMSKYISALKSVSEKIIDDLSDNKNLLINLVDIKNIDGYTYQHSLNVAILSTIIGIEMKFSKDDLGRLFIGALLHDIGKAFIPKDVINKKGTLTDEESEIMKEHPLLGYNYIRESYGIHASSKIVAYQHHEKFDGTGYPKGAYGEFIHKFSRIVAITDCYDSMTSDSPHSRALPPNEALEFIMGSADSHFDFNMVQIFSRKVIPYPEGTIVKMSNGNLGIIEAVNINYPLRPVIKIFEKNVPVEKMKAIDLMVETNITITGIQYEDPNHTKQ